MQDQPKNQPVRPVVFERLDIIEATLARIEAKLTVQSIQMMRPRAKPGPKVKPTSKYRRILAMLKAGKTPSDIARETGEVHIGAIVSRAKKKGDWVPPTKSRG